MEVSKVPLLAPVVKLVDTQGLGSCAFMVCGFESHRAYLLFEEVMLDIGLEKGCPPFISPV